MRVTAPKGLRSGDHLRLRRGAADGSDLYLAVLIRPEDGLSALGDDLFMTWPTESRLMADGGRVEIETYAGTRSAWITADMTAPVRVRLKAGPAGARIAQRRASVRDPDAVVGHAIGGGRPAAAVHAGLDAGASGGISHPMSHNTFGHLFRVTTWGESHGPAIGCVVDGCPPRLALTEADIQPWLDQRKPGGSRFVTQRKESDTARILSGVFDDGDGPVTTGTPISILIENEDQRSKDYGEIARAYRPGHADYAYQAKYGVRDHRGGGRSSARETASRVAAGAVARKVLGDGVKIRAGVVQIGPHRIAPDQIDFGAVHDNPLFAASAQVVGTGRPIWTRCARPARPSARSLRWKSRGFRPVGARRSMASWIRIWRRL